MRWSLILDGALKRSCPELGHNGLRRRVKLLYCPLPHYPALRVASYAHLHIFAFSKEQGEEKYDTRPTKSGFVGQIPYLALCSR